MPALVDVIDAAQKAAADFVEQVVYNKPPTRDEVVRAARESWKDDSDALSVALDTTVEELERYKSRYVSEYIREYERLMEDFDVCVCCGIVYRLDDLYIFDYDRYCKDCYLSIFEYRAYIASEPVELTDDEKRRYIMRLKASVVKNFYTPWTLNVRLKAYDVNPAHAEDAAGAELLVFEKREDIYRMHEEYVERNNPRDYTLHVYVDTFIRG